MTQEEKRIKLAEAGGWKGIVASHMIGYAPWRPVTYEERIKKTPVMEFHSIPLDPLPDYFACLNACHDFEMQMPNDDFVRYANMIPPCATANQRAHLIGKTLSLWNE
jgi:hypothetical protein